jgi:hypothetical protein
MAPGRRHLSGTRSWTPEAFLYLQDDRNVQSDKANAHINPAMRQEHRARYEVRLIGARHEKYDMAFRSLFAHALPLYHRENNRLRANMAEHQREEGQYLPVQASML